MSHKYVYFFGEDQAEGSASMKDLLGGKGAGLAEMTNAGLPVPPGFTITTEACKAYYAAQENFPDGMWDQALNALHSVERITGKVFGDAGNPLLVSVRSGAKFSMPGMMDTILNLGLNEQTRDALARLSGNPRFAFDAYRRLIQMFGKIVLGVPGELFEDALARKKKAVDAKVDTDLGTEDLEEVAETFKKIIRSEKGMNFPDVPLEQLRWAIRAVFASWNGKRAIDYRRVNKIPGDLGTAVNVVAMVFGNMGQDSGTGVAFTRNPSTGVRELYGEYLPNAQGEDVVAGSRTPRKISDLKGLMPEIYDQLEQVAAQLERHYRDVQDLEFTVERGKLWMLQTRNAKRTGAAAVKIAVDMVGEGLIDKGTAVMRIEPSQLDQLLHPMVDPAAKVTVLTRGLPASPGAAFGKVVFDPDMAQRMGEKGDKVILVRTETSPEDFHGMVAAQAILTARGGMTSHAAVVARGMGKCCVAGAAEIEVDYKKHVFAVNSRKVKQGDEITLDGTTGRVILGRAPLIDPELSSEFRELMGWATEARRLGVWANADTPQDATVARNFGAEGIGLCRTEHMFFEGDRIDAVRQMIAGSGDYKRLEAQLQALEQELSASGSKERKSHIRKQVSALKSEITLPRRLYFGALKKLLPMQRRDFVGIFKVMDGLPVTIRSLDPPLHEFLPHGEAEVRKLARRIRMPWKALAAKFDQLREANPMLGHRGCRLGIAFPEVTEMQTQAIMEAAVQVQRAGKKVKPEIMIPLVAHVNELKLQAGLVRKVAEQVMKDAGVRIDYRVGTMIELPRAALTANRIAEVAEFFSFGTNDLTQTTFGLSRDDAGKFLAEYLTEKILPEDPFQSLDQEGVGELIRVAVERGRKTRAELKVGICGEHGGDPDSVKFCHRARLDYVSCSPYRVPIAILAAAQAALAQNRQEGYTTA